MSTYPLATSEFLRPRVTPISRTGVVPMFRHFGSSLFYALATLGTARMSPPKDSRSAATRLADALGAIAVSHDLAPTVLGEVPRSPALIVSNHVSYLDPVAILPIAPALPVASCDIEDWPLVGSIGKHLGALFVKPGDPAAGARTLRRIHALLASGTSVLNFPEGPAVRGQRIPPFWRGSFGIAAHLDAPVVPMAIRYRDPELACLDRAAMLRHYVGTLARPRIEVTLHFGAPLYARTGETAESLATRARGAVQRLLG